jgi:hypothetical protein
MICAKVRLGSNSEVSALQDHFRLAELPVIVVWPRKYCGRVIWDARNPEHSRNKAPQSALLPVKARDRRTCLSGRS